MLAIYLVAIAVTLSFVHYYVPKQSLPYGDINTEQARNLITREPDLVIVDVTTPMEYETGHIEGSVNLCVTCDMEELLNNLDPNHEILLYCRTGRRSASALRFLNENGYQKVYNMVGGIEAWRSAGYPVVKG